MYKRLIFFKIQQKKLVFSKLTGFLNSKYSEPRFFSAKILYISVSGGFQWTSISLEKVTPLFASQSRQKHPSFYNKPWRQSLQTVSRRPRLKLLLLEVPFSLSPDLVLIRLPLLYSWVCPTRVRSWRGVIHRLRARYVFVRIFAPLFILHFNLK